MPKIKILSPQEVQKIAAGEVVERPANIVKELIENSLDAQATQLTIIIKDGGKECIRVIDNGIGMNSDDARMSIINHATSKINGIHDLNSIQTFGFRGEALSSISSVSHMTLITKTAHDEGIQLHIEQGVIQQETSVACTAGTDITINNIFYNVPARKKFLKKRETEYRHILQLVHAVALSHPKIHIKFISDEHDIINCPSANSLKERCAQLWRHVSEFTMHEVHAHRDGIATIAGITTDQHAVRYDRSELFFFVNNRWISNYQLSNALMKGYEHLLPAQRYPHGAIHITCDPQSIDVNIHPRKEEVRFLHPKIIESLIQHGVKKSLESAVTNRLQASAIKTISPTSQSITPFPIDTYIHGNSSEPIEWGIPLQNASTAQTVSMHAEALSKNSDTKIIQTTLAHIHEQLAPEFQTYQLIGQYKKTYLLLEQDEGLYLIDQHAAHERILYEKFTKHFESPVTTTLMFPIMMHLTSQELATLHQYQQLFNDIGILIEPFGVDQLIISATPVCAPHIAYDELIRTAIGWIAQDRQLDHQALRTIIHEKLHTQMACKAAVKAGDILTQETMEQLLRDLDACPNRFSCPHGRPTGWLLPLQEIEKKFKRDYKK